MSKILRQTSMGLCLLLCFGFCATVNGQAPKIDIEDVIFWDNTTNSYGNITGIVMEVKDVLPREYVNAPRGQYGSSRGYMVDSR